MAFKLLASEDQALLFGRDSFLLLNLRLDIFDAIALLHFHADCLPGESFVSDFGTIPSAVDCEDSDCTPSQLRDYYVREWKCLLDEYAEQCDIDENLVVLPQSDAKIVSNNGMVTISMKWYSNVSAKEQTWEVQSNE